MLFYFSSSSFTLLCWEYSLREFNDTRQQKQQQQQQHTHNLSTVSHFEKNTSFWSNQNRENLYFNSSSHRGYVLYSFVADRQKKIKPSHLPISSNFNIFLRISAISFYGYSLNSRRITFLWFTDQNRGTRAYTPVLAIHRNGIGFSGRRALFSPIEISLFMNFDFKYQFCGGLTPW